MKRAFLFLSLALCTAGLPLIACADTVNKYSYSDFAMDAFLQVTVYSAGENPGPQIREELTSLEEAVLSWTLPDSEISKVNDAAGETVEISDTLADLLDKILDLAKTSGGALDPTLGDVIRLWDIGGENPHIPDEDELAAAMTHVGFDQVSLDGNLLTLEEGCSLDLGATGKGIGCEWVLPLFSEDNQISGALVSLGGSSVMTYGQKPDGSDWHVAIRDPRDPDGDYLGVVSLTGTEYLSTSGDYEKYFIENGVRYHHILDPKTGYPAAKGLCSATVVSGSGLLSDGLSTACIVLGAEDAISLLAHYNAEGILVDEDGIVYVTPGINEQFSLGKKNYTLEVID